MFNNILHNFRNNRDGTVAMVFAVALPILIGALAVSIEAGYWMKSKTDLQVTADMAAFAGALELLTYNEDEAEMAATLHAISNGYDFAKGTITVNAPPTSGAYAGLEAVEVLIEQKGNQYFSAIFGTNLINYSVRSVSAVVSDNTMCILALNETAKGAYEITGSGTSSVANCAIGVNSSHSQSINFGGSSTSTMDCIQTVGGFNQSTGATVNPACGAVDTGAELVRNPYKDLTAPDLSLTPACTAPVNLGGGFYSMSPGRYCADINFGGKTTMSAGEYYLDGIDVQLIGSHAELIGNGVTIILMNGATLSGFSGNATITITAPTSGPYTGIAFFSDPLTQPAGDIVTLKGNSMSSIEGLLYFPTQTLKYGGNSSTTSGCTLIVADKILIGGNADFKNTSCRSTYGLDAPGNGKVVLAE